jgi:hypothetical protein
MTYALNVQIVGNHEGRILDLCADWQGATADARIWNASPVKFIIDRQRHYLVAGDSGYPISETCITPYRVAEAAGIPRSASSTESMLAFARFAQSASSGPGSVGGAV